MRPSELCLAAVLALAATGCSGASRRSESKPAARPATHGSRSPAASAATPTPSKLSAVDAWQWVRATLPEETAMLRFDESRANVEKLLAWAPGEAPTVVFDRACRPLTLQRNERTLDGSVNEATTITGKTKTVHRDGIAFGFDITVVCGSDTSYERSPDGAWVEAGSSATGCAHAIGHNLSDVRDGQVWFAAEQVTLTIGCASRVEHDQRCTDGTTRTCKACSAAWLGIKAERAQQLASRGTAGVRHGPAAPVDCSIPCPADELGPMIDAASEALADKAFEQLGHEPHPTLFRSRATCDAYRKKHPIAKDQLDVW